MQTTISNSDLKTKKSPIDMLIRNDNHLSLERYR